MGVTSLSLSRPLPTVVATLFPSLWPYLKGTLPSPFPSPPGCKSYKAAMSRFPPTPSPLSLPVCLFDISHSQRGRHSLLSALFLALACLSFNILCSPLERALLFVSVPITTNNNTKNNQQAYRLTSTQLKTTLNGRGLSLPTPSCKTQTNEPTTQPTSQDVLPAGRSVRSLPLPLLQARS